jgi:hypothetical protein
VSATRPPDEDGDEVTWLGLLDAVPREWSSQEDSEYLTWLGHLNRIENSPRVIDLVCHECGALRTAPATRTVRPACCGSPMVGLFHTLRPLPDLRAQPLGDGDLVLTPPTDRLFAHRNVAPGRLVRAFNRTLVVPAPALDEQRHAQASAWIADGGDLVEPATRIEHQDLVHRTGVLPRGR